MLTDIVFEYSHVTEKPQIRPQLHGVDTSADTRTPKRWPATTKNTLQFTVERALQQWAHIPPNCGIEPLGFTRHTNESQSNQSATKLQLVCVAIVSLTAMPRVGVRVCIGFHVGWRTTAKCD